jgi:hypothetical protein
MAFRKTFFCAAVAAMLALTSISAADEIKPRLGVSIIETTNSAGVIITKIDDDSSAEKLDRVGKGKDLKLEPRKHAITHVNGHQVPTIDSFLEAIAASPKDCTLRLYEYATADWSDHRVKLRGEPTVVETQTVEAAPQYWMDANGNVYSQDGQFQYTQQGYSQQQYTQTDNDGKRSSQKRFFNMFGQPEGDDWRPGDNIWLFQKKPEDKELRKAYGRQAFVEILTGVAAGMSGAAAGMDSYQPSSSSGFNAGRVNSNISRDSFNRNYSTNPDHAPFINWAY